jgi:aarF domain-containing kinase
MAGRRILDAAKLVQAARSIAKQHVALRSEQLDRYSKGSTLAKQAKAQSDRVVLTLQAAAALARRLNEDDNADQFGNAASARAGEHRPGEAATPDQKSSGVQHQGPARQVAVDSHSSDITRNVNGEPAVEDASQVRTSEPRNNAQRLDEIAEEIDLAILRTKRVSQMLESQPKAAETTSNESLAGCTVGSTTATETAENVYPDPAIQQAHPEMRESRVPATRIGRLWQYGGLATSMAIGAIGESLRRATGGSSEGSLILTPANMERLVARLSRMRGAALKLGQVISFQGRQGQD